MHPTSRRRFLKLTGMSGLGVAALCGCSMPRSGSTPPQIGTETPTEAAVEPTTGAATAGPTTVGEAAPTAPPPPIDSRTAELAYQALMEGNERYVAQKLAHPNLTVARLTEVAGGQKPFAAILGCADSRVPPELLFDRGLGDLFVVRGAGNFADDVAIGSLEFAVAALEVPVIMVLGHERCGAVGATVEGGEAPGKLSTLVKAIQPAVEQARKQGGDPGDLVERAVIVNVQMVVEQLKKTGPIIAEAVQSGKLMIVGGRYDLDVGRVEIVT